MKKVIPFLMLILLAAGVPVFSQTYKTMADTAALNKEYVKVNKNIADLKVQIAKTQEEQAKYTLKSTKASNNAQSIAASAANRAADATSGNVKDARRAKKDARRSLHKAKDARKADSNREVENKRLIKLNGDLEKNENRLNDLNTMRSSIMGQ